MTPTNAIEAVTHPDPYPYYDELATRPLWWDDALDIWVAARPDDVRAALGHPAARVRPLDVPVPAGLVGTESGDVFGRLVRMHDRDDRMVVKDAITAALASLDTDQVADAVAASATWVSPIDGRTGRFVDRWIADVPLGAVAALLGVDGVDLSAAVEAGHSVAASFGPTRPADAADRAARAVEVLTGLATTAAIGSSGLAAELCRTLPRTAPTKRWPTRSVCCSRPPTRRPACAATRSRGSPVGGSQSAANSPRWLPTWR